MWMIKKEKEKEKEKEKVRKYKVIILWTNLCNMGLTSADRSNKATLPLTVPCSIQVVCKGFTPAHVWLQYVDKLSKHFPQKTTQSTLCGLQAPKSLIRTPVFICRTNIIVSSTDSDLEAFSHNPTDDSFAPLPDRTDANTKYLNERFLSY